MRHPWAAITAILAAMLAVSMPARAQNVDLQTDLAKSQNDLAAEREPQAPPLPGETIFVINPAVGKTNFLWAQIGLPETYNSNPATATTGLLGSDRFDPKLQLNFGFQLGSLQLSGNSALDADRYGIPSPPNANAWLSTVKLAWNHNTLTDPSVANAIVPYLQYQPSVRFASDFSSTSSRSNDFGGGVTLDERALWFSKHDKNSWQISLDITASRRIANTGDSTSLVLKQSVTLTDGAAKLQFAPSLRQRWFDDALGVSRRDTTLTVPFVLEYDAPFLQSVDGDIAFAVTYTRNYSNLSTKNSEQWNVGPMLELSHLFWSDG